jgi:hypothetical protein
MSENVYTRFHVGCLKCGHVDGCQTLESALKEARAHRQAHAHTNTQSTMYDDVSVMDTMAHQGRPEFYAPDGTVVGWRKRGTWKRPPLKAATT